jgi:plasmid maintenance system antidote protein VapI
MVKDKRYNTVKKLILANALGSFAEIFDTLPKTVLAKDLGMHHQTLTKLLAEPKRFTFERAFDIAELLEVDPLAVANLIAKQCIADAKGKRKR